MFQPYALSHDLVPVMVSLYLLCMILCMVSLGLLLFHFTVGEIFLYFLTFCFSDDDKYFFKVCLILGG